MNGPSSSSASPPEDGDVLDQAVAWAVRLESGRASSTDRQRFAQWHAQSSSHARAWSEVQGVGKVLDGLPASTRPHLREALQTADQVQALRSRRRAIRQFAWGGLALLGGGAGWRVVQLGHAEELRTRVGERHALGLPDGTELQLNTASHAQVAYGPLRRIVHLRDGEIHITTGPDPHSHLLARGFWVHTRHARLEALGTRFSVRVAQQGTRLHVSSGLVAVHGKDRPPFVAHPGVTVQARADSALELRVLADEGIEPDSWTKGLLEVHGTPLGQFLAELSRYQAGPAIEVDAAASQLTVSGVFHLDGAGPVDRALNALQGSLPIRVLRGGSGRIQVTGDERAR